MICSIAASFEDLCSGEAITDSALLNITHDMYLLIASHWSFVFRFTPPLTEPGARGLHVPFIFHVHGMRNLIAVCSYMELIELVHPGFHDGTLSNERKKECITVRASCRALPAELRFGPANEPLATLIQAWTLHCLHVLLDLLKVQLENPNTKIHSRIPPSILDLAFRNVLVDPPAKPTDQILMEVMPGSDHHP
jgi:hypothetical protein